MSKESEKDTIRIDISKTQDEKQTPSPSSDPKVEKTELGVQELEERVAPYRL